MLNFLAQYWFQIFIAIIIVASGISVTYLFFKEPSTEQIKKIKKWLLWAVIEAEKELGSDTGKIKIVQVYDKFISKFPYLSFIITYAMFEKLVDMAVQEMKELLSASQAIASYVLSVPITITVEEGAPAPVLINNMTGAPVLPLPFGDTVSSSVPSSGASTQRGSTN